MIIATAGHVDHGKTSLVHALTGMATDRLAEEKRRGMSIDLGFAHTDMGVAAPLAASSLAFIDVPGHERFVRNMLAGVACIDLGLLVVAADDGPMPQTREHLAILTLLAVPRCVVVLSKIDRVTPERAAQAQAEIQALLADSPYRHAALFALATPSGQGVAALRQHLVDTSLALAQRETSGHFRLVIDRSFLSPGAGRIVTGAVLAGQVRVGDGLLLSPRGAPVRVRGLQLHKQPVELALAGQRCAVNLVGGELRQAQPSRGDWLLAPALHAPTQRLDAMLQWLPGAPRPLVRSMPLQLYIGAAAVAAQVTLLDGAALAPGHSGAAQLLLAAPVAALHGDRFILRDAAAGSTVAGGWVIDPWAPARGRSSPARQTQRAALALADPAAALAALLLAQPGGVDLTQFARSRNLDRPAAIHLQQGLQQGLALHVIGSIGLADMHWQALRQALLAALAQAHAQQPDSLGLAESRLAPAWPAPLPRPLLHAALQSLIADGSVLREGLRLRLAAHQPVLPDDEAQGLARIVALLQPAGLRPPIVGDLALALGLPLPALQAWLVRAQQRGQLLQVAPNRWFLPGTVAELVRQARQLAAESADGGFDAAAFRDRTRIGRNLTVQVLEFMDREGLTHFDGQRRRPLG